MRDGFQRMRIAIVSDIHGNLTALDAVLADLRQTSPDLILNGGDLPQGGSSPVEVLDRIRDLGWPGVVGNTDEMLFRPESLEEFASQSSAPPSLWPPIREMAEATRSLLGEDRLSWLREMPLAQIHSSLALVHASPESCWRSPTEQSSDSELESVYGPLGKQVVVYGHIHKPFLRSVAGMVVANSGSVSLSYDGDRRASYLLVDESKPTIRRVEYDVDREIKALANCGLPHADWMVRTLKSARPQMP
jgi:putative phosphoesterase